MKGVELAIQTGNNFFEIFKTTCHENEHLSANISFGLKKTNDLLYEWKAELVTLGASALIKFSIPFKNSNIGHGNYENTFVSIYAANYYLFEGYNRSKTKSDQVYKRRYYFNVDEKGEAVWTEEIFGHDFTSTKSLVNKFFLEFYNFSKYHRNI